MYSVKDAVNKLREQVKESAARGADIQRRISSLQGAGTGTERHLLWNEKKAVGVRTRHLLLAYGLLRGVPYHRMERQAHIAPNPSMVSRVIIEAMTYEECEEMIVTRRRQRTLDNVSSWSPASVRTLTQCVQGAA